MGPSVEHASDFVSHKRQKCDAMISFFPYHCHPVDKKADDIEEFSVYDEISSLENDLSLESSPSSSISLSPSSPSSPSSASSPSSSVSSATFVPPTRVSIRSEYVLTSEVLGTGQFGEVRTCKKKSTGEFFACKSVTKERLQPGPQVEGLRTEVALTGILSAHPNIAAPLEVFEDEISVHMIMERCNGGDLFSLIESVKRIPELAAAPLIRKIARAIAFCHARGIVHRDIKPENILLQVDPNGIVEPKLADFGLARILTPGEEATGFAGSAFYVAPEVVLDRGSTSATDIWSLGVVIYVMISGCLPFWGTNMAETFSSICSAPINTTSGPWVSISSSAKDLVRRMLCRDPSKRPHVLEVLNHDWLMPGGVVVSEKSVSGNTSSSSTAVSVPHPPPTSPGTSFCRKGNNSDNLIPPGVLVPRPPSAPRISACSPRSSLRSLRIGRSGETSPSGSYGADVAHMDKVQFTAASTCCSSGESGVTCSGSPESSPRA